MIGLVGAEQSKYTIRLCGSFLPFALFTYIPPTYCVPNSSLKRISGNVERRDRNDMQAATSSKGTTSMHEHHNSLVQLQWYNSIVVRLCRQYTGVCR